MRSGLAGLVLLALVLPALAAEPEIGPPEGFVTDRAGVIAPMTWQKRGDQVGDDLWGRADFECPGLSAAQRLSMFGQKV